MNLLLLVSWSCQIPGCFINAVTLLMCMLAPLELLRLLDKKHISWRKSSTELHMPELSYSYCLYWIFSKRTRCQSRESSSWKKLSIYIGLPPRSIVLLWSIHERKRIISIVSKPVVGRWNASAIKLIVIHDFIHKDKKARAITSKDKCIRKKQKHHKHWPN